MKRKIIGILTAISVAAAAVPITAQNDISPDLSMESEMDHSAFEDRALFSSQYEPQEEKDDPYTGTEYLSAMGEIDGSKQFQPYTTLLDDAFSENIDSENVSSENPLYENIPSENGSSGNVPFEKAASENVLLENEPSENVSSYNAQWENALSDGTSQETSSPDHSSIDFALPEDVLSDSIILEDVPVETSSEDQQSDEKPAGQALQEEDKDPSPDEPTTEQTLQEDEKTAPDLFETGGMEKGINTSSGSLVFEGYLPDGTPNYVWVGEGSPFHLEGENTEILPSSLNSGEDLLSDPSSLPEDMLSDSGRPAIYFDNDVLAAGTGSNYYNDPEPQSAWHSSRGKSDTSYPGITDGIHMEGGRARIYQGGQYFTDGGIAVNGIKYYADTDGYLWSGWLKTISKDSGEDITSPKSDEFVYRYYDPSTFQLVTGLITVDGLPHYFDPSSGVLLKEKVVDVDGTFYFSDRYAICGPVRLIYGNVISGNDDRNNDAYLARNQVTAVDASSFKGQDGSYSFRPKWYTGRTSIDVFGFTPSKLGSHLYCTIHDDSLKGRIGVIYRNVGKYKGREIDLRLTITDYTFLDLNGSEEVGYFYIYTSSIGLNCTNQMDITANMEFLDHETQQRVTVKGYATFSDIDIGQSIEILSPVDEIFVDSDCQLYKDPDSLTFTSKFIYPRVGSVINDPDPEYWVQVNYNSDHLTYRFGNSYDQYVFDDTGLKVNGASWYVWKDGYTRSVLDYSLYNTSTNTLRQSWQGLYFKRLGMVSVPPLTKLVSDRDESMVEENTLQKADEAFTYTLAHNVPGESDQYYYSDYVLTDTVPDSLYVIPDSLKVLLDDDTDVTGRFSASVSGQTVTFKAVSSWLSTEDFYDNNYNYQFKVKIRDDFDLEPYRESGFQVKNTGTVTVQRLGETETSASNEVVTNLYFPKVSVQKTDAQTGMDLTGAGFTIYPYSKSAGGYTKEGELLAYDTFSRRYISRGLILTEDNDMDGRGNHRFLLKETKVPDGYKDESWQQEVTVKASDQTISVFARNTADELTLCEIRITKRILEADIWWPHGNPTFLFAVEGMDEKGNPHRYEEFICFRQGEYTVDQEGYAYLSRTISKVPAGTYKIFELPVNDYYLTGVSGDTSNVTITWTGPAQRDKDPIDTAYGTAVLTREQNSAGITFTDQKGDYRWYRHTDVVENVIPVILN